MSKRRRMVYLLTLLVIVAGSAGGYWYYQARQPVIPDPPRVPLDGIDHEVAETVKDARRTVDENRNVGRAWGQYGMILHIHSFTPEAALCYEQAEALEKDNPYWPYLHGLILIEGADPAAALPYLHRAADLTLPNAPPRMQLADLLLELERLDEAGAEYQKGLAANSKDPHAQFGMGQVAVARQQYREALPFLQAVADVPYAQKRSCLLRLTAYERLDQREAAKAERERLAKMPANAVDPPWPDAAKEYLLSLQVGLQARLQRATVLLRQMPPQAKEAVNLLQGAVRQYPESDQAWALLAHAWAADDDMTHAEEAVLKAIDLAKSNPDHWASLGALRQSQRKYQAAAQAFHEAVRLRPTNASAYYHLGECLQELKDRKGAADAYRSTLRHRPDMEEARKKLVALEGK